MTENRGFDLFDIFIIFLKRKKFFINLFLISLILSYVAIYFLVQEEFDSTSLIISSKQDSFTGMSSLIKNFSNLPFGLGGMTQSDEIDKYKTIIYSRTNLDKIIGEYNLLNDYNLESMEKARKILKSKIIAEETREEAFTVTVRANSPQKTVEINKFIIKELNDVIISLNVKKARDNRNFLADRYNEIKINLSSAEDSLKKFQSKNGVLEIENQVKTSIEEYSKLEAELATRKIELDVLKKVLGENSPQIKNQEISVEEFQNYLNRLQTGNIKNPVLMPINSMPTKALDYLRLLRDVKIYSSMLEFIIPLYEQAKFDEQKEIPILQVIDYPVEPEKKAYPPRTLYALLIALSISLFTLLYFVITELSTKSTNPKLIRIKNEFRWRKAKDNDITGK